MSVEIILMAGLSGTRALIGNSVEFGSASNPTAAVQGAKLKILMVFNDKPPGGIHGATGIQERRGIARQESRRIHRRQFGLRLVEGSAAKFGLQLGEGRNFVPVGSTSSALYAR